MADRNKTRSLRSSIGIAFLFLTLIIILNSALGIFGLYRSSQILTITAKVESMSNLATSTEAYLQRVSYMLLDFSH